MCGRLPLLCRQLKCVTPHYFELEVYVNVYRALFIATVTHTFMDIRRRRAALRQQQQQPVSVVIQMEAPKQEYPAV